MTNRIRIYALCNGVTNSVKTCLSLICVTVAKSARIKSWISLCMNYSAQKYCWYSVPIHAARSWCSTLHIMAISPSKRGGPQRPKNFWDPLVAPVQYDLEQPNSALKYIWGRACFLVVSRAPIPRGGVPVLPNLSDAPLFMPTPFDEERPNSTW